VFGKLKKLNAELPPIVWPSINEEHSKASMKICNRTGYEYEKSFWKKRNIPGMSR
jgi:hypothetical protein